MIEPLDDKELNRLLQSWEAPDAPDSLRRRVVRQRQESWGHWLTRGTIRVPVPVVGVAVLLVLGLWIVSRGPAREPVAQPATSVTLADFQPVRQLEPTIVEKHDGANESEKK